MGDVLRNWIQARLGILIDLRPEVFGYYTRDGSLLAQILHSYDIITQDQLDIIIVTQDPALCRVNLRHLSFWLRFIAIKMDEDLIDEISCGKGTSSLRLFYKVYLCLESKERLHFITLQKEREKFVPTSKKFDVVRVCEDPPPYHPSENKLSKKLVKGQDVIQWHQQKVPKMLRSYIKKKKKTIEKVETKCVTDVKPCYETTKEDYQKKVSKELDDFATKHSVSKELEKTEKEEESEEDLKPIGDDPDMAKSYIEWLKNRKKRAEISSALKSKMQKSILSELWERMAEKQDRTVDEELAKRVLDQSRYEKQIMTKLCEIHEQKNIMAENQRVVEDIILQANEMEDRAKYYRSQDLVTADEKDMKIECQRMCELRHRLHVMKIEKIRKKHWSICQKVIDDLLTIAFNICEHRQLNDGHIPLTLISEWRRLFLKSEPIVEKKVPFDLDTPKHELETFIKADDWSKHVKIEILQDTLFDDYMELNEPWNFLLTELDEDTREVMKLGRLVLGYIVHRLLDGLYARPADPSKRLKIKMKNISIILGIDDAKAYETLSMLLEQSNFHLVRMEDAINHCLQQYKKEMADFKYIDLNIILATTQLIDVQTEYHCLTMKHVKRSRWADEVSTTTPEPNPNLKKATNKQVKENKSFPINIHEEEMDSSIHKQTQTPRNIPYDDIDPILTDTAHIGKWTYEFLTLGEPITNDLGTKIIIEYLKSKMDAKGWVFVDYPTSYDQMSWLETTMGMSPPPDPKELEIKDINVEDIEIIKPRIIFEDKSDPYALQRTSKIMPNSILEQIYDYKNNNTFVSLFVRMKQQPRDFEKGDRTYEKISKITPSIDGFYAFHKIAYVFHYSSFDLPTLKKLARLVLGYPKKMSRELFGDILEMLEMDPHRLPITKDAVIRRLVTDEEFAELELVKDMDEEEEEEMKHDVISEDFQLEFDLKPSKPGELNWQWINFPLPSMLLQNMAKLWEILEDIYIEEVKELLYLKSVHSSSIVPYTGFLHKNAMQFIKRPDHKQDMIYEFQQAFNSIDMDARKEVDVKCELHRRVADFQAELWEICDDRRRVAEEERKRYVSFEWAIQEAVILYDIFVGLIQAEIDRCIDTQHLLQDYYMGMLKKPLRELGVSKVVLNKIDVETMESEDNDEEEEESPIYEEKLTDQRKKDRSKFKVESQAQSSSPIAICRLDIQKEINQVLLERSKMIVNIEDTCMFKGIMKNVVYVREILDTLFTVIQETIKREQVTFKGKDFTFIDSIESINNIEKMASRVQDLFLEWRYVSNYEILRVRQKLESIVNVARLDFDFLVDTMQRLFHDIYDAIVDRYWQEMKSVNDMVNVFCFAIEEGKMLEKEMELKGDKFIIKSNVYVVKMRSEKPKRLKEYPSMRFRIIKLSHLMDMFKQVAPIGIMSERTLVYILQDLVCHGLEEGEPMMLPCRWYDLCPEDISNLINRIFKSVNYVDWREFLIYAMDIPYPTCREILITRDRLRIQDYELKEVVTLAQYQRTSFWFFESTENLINLTRLHEEIVEEKLDMYEEKYYHFDVDKISILSKGIQRAYIMPHTLETSSLDPEEALRRLLAKDLLGQMYMVDYELINYTALLLAFCKNEDPRKGFAMALALAIGNPVCTDMEEGERYVKELLYQKQLAHDLGIPLFQVEEAVKVAKLLINYILNKIEKIIEQKDLYCEEESPSSFKFFDESVDPEEEAFEDVIEDEEIETPPELSELIIYWISFDLCLTVLAAALPWYLLLQPDIIGQYPSMHEKLASVFEELRDERLNHEKNVVLAHRFLNHNFMKQLLTNVTKFTIKNIAEIVEEIIVERENAKSQENAKFS